MHAEHVGGQTEASPGCLAQDAGTRASARAAFVNVFVFIAVTAGGWAVLGLVAWLARGDGVIHAIELADAGWLVWVLAGLRLGDVAMLCELCAAVRASRSAARDKAASRSLSGGFGN